jgi:phosphohistidine phosphatase SixA
MREGNRGARKIQAAARVTLLLLGLGVFVNAAGAEPKRQELVAKLQGIEIVAALKQGGKVILLRHTATEGRSDETIKFRIEDCASQRNLSEQGKREATEIGDALRRLGIQVDAVYSSPYCRTLETGRLAFGKVTPSDSLSVADSLTMDGKIGRGGDIRKLLDTAPPPGTNTVLITHTGNLLYAFGLDSRPEGIAHVFEPNGSGRASYLGSLKPDDWSRLAGPPPTEDAKP